MAVHDRKKQILLVLATISAAIVAPGGCANKQTSENAKPETIVENAVHQSEPAPATEPSTSVPQESPRDAAPTPAVRYKGLRHIKSMNHFEEVVKLSGKDLLVFELYADWCMPCRILAPLLDSIAHQYADRALFYKVDTDAHPWIGRVFGARGIPHVAFVKDSMVVYSLSGMRPREHYVQIIEKYSPPPAKPVSTARPFTTQGESIVWSKE